MLSFDSSGTTCESQGTGTLNICADGGIFVNNVLLNSGSDSGSDSTSATVADEDGNAPLPRRRDDRVDERDDVDFGVSTLGSSAPQARQKK